MADVTEPWTDDAAESLAGDDEATPEDVHGEVPDDTGGIPDEPEVFAEELRAEQNQPAADVPETGDGRVDEVLSKLSGIEGRPTTEHVGVYDEVHRGLQDALANLDQG